MHAKNILCPVDFSEHFDSALRLATTLAKEDNATLHLVHVYEDISHVDAGFGGYAPPPMEADECRQKLEHLQVGDGIEAKREMIKGHPADAILEYASRNNVDLIVMGTHGRTGLSRLLMGSVAEQIVRKSKCPVLTVREPTAVEMK